MAEYLHHHVTSSMWPTSSIDVNPLDYSTWGVAEKQSSKSAHNTIIALRAAIVDTMANIPKIYLITVCSRLLEPVEVVIATDGSFVE